MEARREDEVSRRPAGDLNSNQTVVTISSLNEAWLHTLDEYVADTPLSQIILPLMRACFFSGATYAVLLLQKGHADRVAADIAGFLTEQPRL
jgi:hypothetical protein